ncbi:MAG: aminotransferase class V-fold PLP-dependent enzyme [Clostridiales bacterium]|nr:aminotransferase class V-fold PLP-dependent enzyme [Clostridiales bacterium]
MIYLDNAATTSPKPPAVREAVAVALRQYSANPGRSGHQMSLSAAEAVYGCRKKAADFFHAPSEERVVFTLNCTEAVNFVLKGLLHTGDHAVTSSLEHNAVMRPLEKLARQGVAYDVAEVIFEDPEATLRSFIRAVKPNTKLVICTHASNVTGAILPIADIGRFCRERGILFAVDAAQSAGILPIDMQEMCIDFLCVAAHKGLYAPMGTGLLICAADLPDTLIEGGTGTNSISLLQPDELPERLESGTINTPGIVGLRAGIDFVEKKGPARIYAHELRLITRLYDAMEEMSSIRLYTGRPCQGLYAPVLSFNVSGLSSPETAALLDKAGVAARAGLHCAPAAHKRIGTLDQGTVRFCPSVFTRPEEISRVLEVLRQIDRKQRNARNY